MEADMTVPKTPPIVPIEYAGKWIAWDFEQTKIVASGRTYAETIEAAQATGEKRPILEKTPDARVRFLGGYR
jgi:hypothetical protein